MNKLILSFTMSLSLVVGPTHALAQSPVPEARKQEEQMLTDASLKALVDYAHQGRDLSRFSKTILPKLPKTDHAFYKEVLGAKGPFPKVTHEGRVLTVTSGEAKVTMEFPNSLEKTILVNGKPWQRTAGLSAQQEVEKLLKEYQVTSTKTSLIRLIVPEAHAGFLDNMKRQTEIPMVKAFTVMFMLSYIWDDWIKPNLNEVLCGWKVRRAEQCQPQNSCMKNGGNQLITYGERENGGDTRIRYRADFEGQKMVRYEATVVKVEKVNGEEKETELGKPTEVFFNDDQSLQRIELRPAEAKKGEAVRTRTVSSKSNDEKDLEILADYGRIAAEIRGMRYTCDKNSSKIEAPVTSKSTSTPTSSDNSGKKPADTKSGVK